MQKLLLLITVIGVSFLFSCTDQAENVDTSKDAAITEAVDSVLVSLNERIRNNPKDPNLYFSRAKYLFENNKNVDAAIADMARAFVIDSTKTEYYVYLSDLYLSKGLFTEVKETLERGLE
nr:hypothetical protein [Bacteroidota bacterium]